jgi:SAM-dependent methyltransferase
MSNNKINKEQIKDSWNNDSDNYYARTYNNTDILFSLKQSPCKAFPSTVWQNICRYFPDLHGVKVCVPSSGDNIAVFAFHLLGAAVTSCDISSEQIKNAKRIADAESWNIEFHVCDSMELSGVRNDIYDLVYTSNGVHTWISDLEVMYGNFYRILKNTGKYIFFETHPFIRPFDDSTNTLLIKKRYDNTDGNDWRVQDFTNSLIACGFAIQQLNELFAEKDCIGAEWWHKDKFDWDAMADWHKNPYAALPQWISFCAAK